MVWTLLSSALHLNRVLCSGYRSTQILVGYHCSVAATEQIPDQTFGRENCLSLFGATTTGAITMFAGDLFHDDKKGLQARLSLASRTTYGAGETLN